MPDVYSKGQPHVPVADIGGHYVGMHPPLPGLLYKPEKLWWRGDEVEVLQAEITELKRARALSAEASATMRDESIAKSERIAELESQLATVTQRRPPKRAGKP